MESLDSVEEQRISKAYVIMRENEHFVEAGQIKRVFGGSIKEYASQELVVICREDTCLPMILGDEFSEAFRRHDKVYLRLEALKDFLKFEYKWDGENLEIKMFWEGQDVTKPRITITNGTEGKKFLAVGDPMPDFALPEVVPNTGVPGPLIRLSGFGRQKLAIYSWSSY